MSIWDYIPFGDEISDFAHQVTGIPTAAQRREQSNLINAQIKAYKDQTEITRQELATKKDEMDAEKRRVEEKQIRALRGNYRAAGSGFLGNKPQQQQELANTNAADMSNKLGG